jgi:hypothetical protein
MMTESVQYAGNICTVGSSYVVRLTLNHRLHRKSFTWSKFDSKQAARVAAEDYRRHLSDTLSVTRRRVLEYVTNTVCQFVAGFLDADGSIQLDGNTVRVVFYQSNNSEVPAILQYISKYYTGYYRSHVPLPPSRKVWHFVVTSHEAHRLLDDLLPYVIIKRDTVRTCLLFYRLHRQKLVTQTLYCQFKWMLQVQHTLPYYQAMRVDAAQLSDAYVAGFHDGDGTVAIYGSRHVLRFGIRQKQNSKILLAIQQRYECGSVYGRPGDDYVCHGRSAIKLIRAVLPYSVQKREQLQLAVGLFDGSQFQTQATKKRSAEHIAALEQAVLTLKAMKRK